MKGHAVIEANIEIIDNDGMVIVEVDGQPASRKVQIMRQNDKYKAIMGDTQAKVNVNLSESIGGPYGYSNAKISVSVTLTCDQSTDSVQKAQQYCLDECVEFIETNIGLSHQMLVDHLKRHYVKEG
jgi:hypothetical protein